MIHLSCKTEADAAKEKQTYLANLHRSILKFCPLIPAARFKTNFLLELGCSHRGMQVYITRFAVHHHLSLKH